MVILSVQEAAKFLGKTPAALRNGYKRWGVPHFRLGGQIKFTQEALQEWVEKGMTVESNEPAGPVKNGRRTRRVTVETKATSHSGTPIV